MTEPRLPPTTAPQVTVSIVSHGQGVLVRKLLACLDTVSAGHIAKAIITLNIPEPGALAGVRCGFPVEVVLNDAPRGFGHNHNRAFQRCTTPWFLVLNPDILFHKDPIGPLLADATAQDIGLLAPRILEPGRRAPEPHRRLLTPLEILLRHRRVAPRRADWVAGMFMLFRASAFEQVGGFDRRYFMYVEDADICARLQLAGWRLLAADDVAVVHEAQRASQRRLRPMVWHMSSLLKWWLSVQFWRSLANRDRFGKVRS
jgi:hypothetical protein